MLRNVLSILIISFMSAAFAVGCLGGCQERPLTPAQEQIAQEIAKAKAGDFITTRDNFFFVTRVNDGHGRMVIAMDFCPGEMANAKGPREIARWDSPTLVPRGTPGYPTVLNAWFDHNPNGCD